MPYELAGTQRIYLTSRPLSAGIIDAVEAQALLKRHLHALGQAGVEGCILEGGSISLLNALATDADWPDQFLWQWTCLQMGTPEAFLDRARRRVKWMLTALPERPSLLQELAILWSDSDLHEKLEDIDGYRVVIQLTRARGLSPRDLPIWMDEPLQAELVERIAQDYLAHAQWQQRDLPMMPRRWPRTSVAADTFVSADRPGSQLSGSAML